MAVALRLSRIGKKNVPIYRIVAVDSRKKRDGASLANLGTYNGLEAKIITIDEQGINDWIAKGATVSDTVKRIMKINKKSQQPEAPVKAKKAVAKKVEVAPAQAVEAVQADADKQ